MSYDKANMLVGEFGLLIGLDDLSLNEEGYCALLVDEKNTLHIKYIDESNVIRLFMEIGRVPDESLKEIRKLMLDANILWRGTDGSVLGIDEESNMATTFRQESIAEMHLPQLQEMVDSFITCADIWTLKIQGKEMVEDTTSNQYNHFTV